MKVQSLSDRESIWNLLWQGLAAGDRNGGPIRLATLLHQSLIDGNCQFDEQKVFDTYAKWFWKDGFDTGPTMEYVMSWVRSGNTIEEGVQKYHQQTQGNTAGIAPAHRSAPLLMIARDEELVDLAMREARLTHWDPIAGKISAASFLLCQYLLEEKNWNDIQEALESRFALQLHVTEIVLSRGGFAPRVFESAWYFLRSTNSFADALQKSLDFAGSANYCPVLVGLWGSCLYKNIPKYFAQHPMCPSNSTSTDVVV